MNHHQITLVQDSWGKVAPIAPQAAALFYQNLFATDPSLQQLFRGDMVEQGKKLTQMISLAVSKLHDTAVLIPALQQLGRRHVQYGVEDAHYAVVGSALLKTLEQGLGEAFTPEVKDAWATVYGVMADVMIKAAKAQ